MLIFSFLAGVRLLARIVRQLMVPTDITIRDFSVEFFFLLPSIISYLTVFQVSSCL